jgi:glycosyltransferase involved in cell wall biosynthesis
MIAGNYALVIDNAVCETDCHIPAPGDRYSPSIEGAIMTINTYITAWKRQAYSGVARLTTQSDWEPQPDRRAVHGLAKLDRLMMTQIDLIDEVEVAAHEPAAAANGRPADLIFISMENWDEIWRRNQFLCAGLARRCPQRKILFVTPALDVSHSVRHGDWRTLQSKTTWTVPGMPNITVMHPLEFAPTSVPAGRKLNEQMARAQVRRMARRLNFQSPLLWLNPHSAVHMVGHVGERAVVYDITDDWISLRQSPAMIRLTRSQDMELCRRADAVIVCSQHLYDMKRDMAKHLFLIPNGVDAAHYRQVIDDHGPLPEVARDWAHPVLGYTGTLHADRLDLDLIETLSHGMPHGSIVLIGPNQLTAANQARLAALPNLRIPGQAPYEQLPQLMRGFDVCITPHLVTPFTESLNPLKLWEYLAAGKPIVATDVAGFRDYAGWVRIAHDPAEFLAAVKEALTEPEEIARARRNEAEGHAWEARLSAVESVLRGCQSREIRGGSNGR